MAIPESKSGEVTEGFFATAETACSSSNVNQKYQSSLSTVKPTRIHAESLFLFLHLKVNITLPSFDDIHTVWIISEPTSYDLHTWTIEWLLLAVLSDSSAFFNSYCYSFAIYIKNILMIAERTLKFLCYGIHSLQDDSPTWKKKSWTKRAENAPSVPQKRNRWKMENWFYYH